MSHLDGCITGRFLSCLCILLIGERVLSCCPATTSTFNVNNETIDARIDRWTPFSIAAKIHSRIANFYTTLDDVVSFKRQCYLTKIIRSLCNESWPLPSGLFKFKEYMDNTFGCIWWRWKVLLLYSEISQTHKYYRDADYTQSEDERQPSTTAECKTRFEMLV